MKRTRIELSSIADMQNLYMAAWKTMQGRRAGQGSTRFWDELELNLNSLHGDIMNGEAPKNDYSRFMIHDPKKREIHAPCLQDRVLHHAVINCIGSVLDIGLIDQTFACRKGKGALYAVKYAQNKCRKGGWFIKADIKKYFASIDQEVLIRMLQKKFKGEDFLLLLERIVNGFGVNGTGLPIGALTSQYFANFYLNPLDRFIMQTVKPSGYVRYMDDLAWWLPVRSDARESFRQVKKFAWEYLRLEVKDRFELNRVENGMTFCGYRIFPGSIKLTRRRKRRYISGLRFWEYLYESGKISSLKLQSSYAAVHGISAHGTHKGWQRSVHEYRSSVNA